MSRGPVRPFPHFMKTHTEKNHKPPKNRNSYGEWDLKRTCQGLWQGPQCACGCPYGSRTASRPHICQTSQDPCRKKDLPSKKEERWKSSNMSRRYLIRLNHYSINQSLKLTFKNYKLQKLGGSIFWQLPYSSNAKKQILTTLLRYSQKLLL